MAFKLLVEKPDLHEFEYILEEKNDKSEPKLFVSGPYMQFGEKNRNGRIYEGDEMCKEVARYTEEMINQKRALGELNHPTSAEVNPEKACHMVTELKQNGNVFYGKSQVLSTPVGNIMKSLIMDGVKLGMSSRALGQLEEKDDANYVKEMRLVAVDCVADPSFPKAFVNGILESKQYVLSQDGSFSETYDNFESGIKNLPRKDLDVYLKEQICSFLNKINRVLD
jgi:hypothetical protein